MLGYLLGKVCVSHLERAHPFDTTPTILLATRHETLASAATTQLTGQEFRLQRLPPGGVSLELAPQAAAPVLALVDFGATTKEGEPLWWVIQGAFGCPIVLVATSDQASQAAAAVVKHRLCDYVLPSAAEDPARLRYLVRKCMLGGQDDRTALETVTELWDAVRRCVASPHLRDLADDLMRTILLLCGEGDEIAAKLFRQMHRLRNRLSCEFEAGGGGGCGGGKKQKTGPILVVEDDDVSAEYVKGILEQHGYEVVLAQTLPDAKAAFVRRRPALALVDVHLGVDSGIDLVRAIRGTTRSNTPVIMVSSDCNRTTVMQSARANVQGYVVKPYEPAALVDKVRAALASAQECEAAF